MSKEWILGDGKPVAPTEHMYSVGDLEPATTYQLKVTAHNNIGSTHALYNFTTLTIDGGNFPILTIRFKFILIKYIMLYL